MNLNEIHKIVSSLKQRVFKKANSHSIGALKSSFKGTGLQFREHQIYQHGDEIRFIDWKLLAKTSTPFIKTFEEERNVEIVIVIDAGMNMWHGHRGKTKFQAACEITCLMYLLAKETNDQVRTIIISNDIITLPKLNGDKGVAAFVSALDKHNLNFQEVEIDNLPPMGHCLDRHVEILKHVKRNREIILLSDFLDFLDPNILRQVVFNKNVHAFRILGPLDEMDKTPFTILGRGENGDSVYQSASHDLVEKNLNLKKVKTLRVKERYLDEFIKEML